VATPEKDKDMPIPRVKQRVYSGSALCLGYFVNQFKIAELKLYVNQAKAAPHHAKCTYKDATVEGVYRGVRGSRHYSLFQNSVPSGLY
jgi:hypothetical protein